MVEGPKAAAAMVKNTIKYQSHPALMQRSNQGI
jgi:hypothetical protein